jgi:hypothetical protein
MYCLCVMCTVLLPPGHNPITVNKYIIFYSFVVGQFYTGEVRRDGLSARAHKVGDVSSDNGSAECKRNQAP